MSNSGGTARISATFDRLRETSRKALIIYLMAGDPDPELTLSLVPKLKDAGADIVELGFPFSDPVADGPVIQEGSQRAMAHMSDLHSYLDLVRKIRAQTDLPLVCMTYYNLIFRYGHEAFFRDGLDAGLDGLIIPDLPLVEAGEWRAQSEAAGIASIFLEPPNSEEEDARAVAEASRGFIYLVSLKGVTGSERGMGENLKERIERLRGLTKTPLAVGFGISTPEQAGQFGAISDGVIVGSGVVSRIGQAPDHAAAEAAVLDYVRTMREGLDRG